RPRPPRGPALLCLFGLATPATRMAEAHPVAQGTMEVMASLDRVTVLVTVSNEEILVAAASGRGAASPREAARGHADYLLAHLHITAEGIPLAGRVVEWTERPQGRSSYRLEYGFPNGPPARLVFG